MHMGEKRQAVCDMFKVAFHLNFSVVSLVDTPKAGWSPV